jgi:hypothetical protein
MFHFCKWLTTFAVLLQKYAKSLPFFLSFFLSFSFFFPNYLLTLKKASDQKPTPISAVFPSPRPEMEMEMEREWLNGIGGGRRTAAVLMGRRRLAAADWEHAGGGWSFVIRDRRRLRRGRRGNGKAVDGILCMMKEKFFYGVREVIESGEGAAAGLL